MKFRHLFATLSLAIVAGAGVVAGVSSGNAQKAEAIYDDDGNYTMYLQPTNCWNYAGARFAIHYYGTNLDGWVDCTEVSSSGNYRAIIPSASTGVNFCRMNGATTENNWNNRWGQTQGVDLSNIIGKSNNVYTITRDNGNYAEGYWSCEYLPDVTANKAFLRGTWANGWNDISKEMTISDGVATINNVSLATGQEIKMMQVSSTHYVEWVDASGVKGDGGATYEDGNIIVHSDANYNISVNLSTKEYTVNAYIDPNLTAATEFASGFVTSIKGNCLYDNDQQKYTGKTTSDLATAWKAQSEAYAVLDGGAIAYLNVGQASTVKAIEDFADVYDYVYAHYKTLLDDNNGGNFANRSVTPVVSQANPVLNVENNPTTIIALVGVVSLVAIGGFFFIRRKRA